jgi:hypothetical protein
MDNAHAVKNSYKLYQRILKLLRTFTNLDTSASLHKQIGQMLSVRSSRHKLPL